MMNSYSMTQLAASVAKAMNAEAPKESAPAIPAVDHLVQGTFRKAADRVLIYNPDCIGMWFWQKYTDLFQPIMRNTQLAVPVSTVMPSVTPVCFGTMYTGAMPEVHGIRSYAKPVIRIDSLFDSLRRSGKKVALVAVADSSMAKIFAERDIDYYILPDDAAVTDQALELVREDQYDLISVYNQEYDDMIHSYTPEAPLAMAAAEHHIRDFGRLADAVKQYWQSHDSMIVWASDHGNHMDWDGHGNHGEYCEDDINVMHFYGVFPRR
ncbi:MAG: hypothetical protein VB055_04025 [Oscillospiraceae bacterium]|nr:hypothetical protein [Oscillospiraceae bacterium]